LPFLFLDLFNSRFRVSSRLASSVSYPRRLSLRLFFILALNIAVALSLCGLSVETLGDSSSYSLVSLSGFFSFPSTAGNDEHDVYLFSCSLF